MTEKQKKQIDVCRQNGLTISATAAATGLSVSAIKSYCSRRNNSEQPSDFHCKFCGAALMQTEGHRRKHFCDQSCYFRWRYSQGDLKRTVYEKKCAYCGKAFTAESKKEQKSESAVCLQRLSETQQLRMPLSETIVSCQRSTERISSASCGSQRRYAVKQGILL